MRSLILAASAALLLASTAQAGIIGGDTTNNVPVANGGTALAGAAAGAVAGAAAGANSTATALGVQGQVAKGGDANQAQGIFGSGNSTNRNDLSQIGIQSTDVDASSRNANVNGNLNANRTGDVTGSQAVSQDGNNADQRNTMSVDARNQSTYEAQARNPVNTAYAAPLVASADTCMGSTTAGGQGVSFGLSLGHTWTDRNCVRLKLSRELNAMGYSQAACELLMVDKEAVAAMSRAGSSCGQRPAAPLALIASPPEPAPAYVPAPSATMAPIPDDYEAKQPRG